MKEKKEMREENGEKKIDRYTEKGKRREGEKEVNERN